MFANVIVHPNSIDNELYDYVFSVEVVNNLVLNGTSFRDAYKQVGLDIESGNFKPSKTVQHTHEGSIGNLQNEQIKRMFDEVKSHFNFEKIDQSLEKLINH